jgi:hypothetical protein
LFPIGIEQHVDDSASCSFTEEQTLFVFIEETIMAAANLKFPECPDPCLTTTYQFNVRKSDINSGTSVFIPDFKKNPRKIFSFGYEDLRVRLIEQVKLVSFNGFIGAFGGSLGLFLGFSCMSTLLALINYVQHYI